MPQLPTPPTSRAGSEFPESKASTECLDDLLERYLGLLDQQQKLQAELAKQLSSGFFALAQANFSCPPGRRYGSDYYDERMKATRNISIKSERDPDISEELQESESTTDAPDSVTFSIELSGNASEDAEENDTAPSSKEEPETSEPTATETTSSESTPDEKPEVRKKFRSTDPIHWYGILVPQSLRKAQSTFTAVVDNQVPDLASTALEMRALEQRISKLQAQLESED
ncbi:hypothetical protein N7541_005176 [Penicillium brevicompactum]|uniref:Vacuolar ATPase assembly protein VMA22 n=1 Tax=Penicillium brevicompactum TaxID=5074 RepID=A0A9W9RI80_PENBR|nr:hypothetical protein N7541_005176 [Penicillium brevicompactum]